MRPSVIVSTHNRPKALEMTLWGLHHQTRGDFEVLIADDGSSDETRTLIDRFRTESPLKIRHVWQENLGFRKGRILNQAIARAAGDYLIFLDGDCIPRNDFVASHCRLAQPSCYLAGGSHINIPRRLQAEICRGDIDSQRVFQVAWLAARGMAAEEFRFRLTRNPWLARLLDKITPRAGVLIGANASVGKKDVLAVNGFDESYAYGSDDKDLGVRMTNNGVKSRRLKYSLVTVHLSHPRAYAVPERVLANKQRLQQVRAQRTTWTPHGICPSGSQAREGERNGTGTGHPYPGVGPIFGAAVAQQSAFSPLVANVCCGGRPIADAVSGPPKSEGMSALRPQARQREDLRPFLPHQDRVLELCR